MARITLDQLDYWRVCCWSQQEVFKSVFPRGMEVTIENLRRLQEAGFNTRVLPRLLPSERGVVYETLKEKAMEDFESEVSLAREKYRRRRKQALAKLRDAKTEALVQAFNNKETPNASSR